MYLVLLLHRHRLGTKKLQSMIRGVFMKVFKTVFACSIALLSSLHAGQPPMRDNNTGLYPVLGQPQPSAPLVDLSNGERNQQKTTRESVLHAASSAASFAVAAGGKLAYEHAIMRHQEAIANFNFAKNWHYRYFPVLPLCPQIRQHTYYSTDESFYKQKIQYENYLFLISKVAAGSITACALHAGIIFGYKTLKKQKFAQSEAHIAPIIKSAIGGGLIGYAVPLNLSEIILKTQAHSIQIGFDPIKFAAAVSGLALYGWAAKDTYENLKNQY